MNISGKAETAKKLHVLTAPNRTSASGTGAQEVKKRDKKITRRNSRHEEKNASFATKD